MNRQHGTDKQYGVKTRKRQVPVMWNLWSLAYTSFICIDVMMHGHISKCTVTLSCSALVRQYVLEMHAACLSVVASEVQQQPICSIGNISYCLCYINRDG